MQSRRAEEFGSVPIWRNVLSETWSYDFGVQPGNANLPIGDGGEAQSANREIGVPMFQPQQVESTLNSDTTRHFGSLF
jgi:hypothetical protein